MTITIPYPKNKKEWWDILNSEWVNILSILHKFIGMNDRENIDGEITLEPRSIEIETMKKERDPRLVRYLSAAWQNAPDVMGLHEIPGWNVLCDLLSEQYIILHDS